jgi:hypothetical protein
VEHPSQVAGFTNFLLKIEVFIDFSELYYEIMVVHLTLCMRMVLGVVVDDLLIAFMFI